MIPKSIRNRAQGVSLAIKNELYPMVKKALDNNSGLNKYKQMMAQFMSDRQDQFYATGPLDRIFYTDEDAENFYKSLDLTKSMVMECIHHTYYWKIANFNPKYAKDPVTILGICVIKYFNDTKDEKLRQLASLYLAFSVKMYPSVHAAFFKVVTPAKYAYVMDYVVNNMNNRYELKNQGSVIGAIRVIVDNWLSAYAEDLKSFDDNEIAYLLQQLRNRIKSFMMIVAKLYYEAYENKEGIRFNNDNETEDSFHLAPSVMIRGQEALEKTITYMTNSGVDYKFCKLSANADVKVEELKTILEAIRDNKEEFALTKEFCKLLIFTFLAQYPTLSVLDIKFIVFSTAIKPNTKDPYILRIKEILSTWLNSNSVRYRKRQKKIGMRYFTAITMYHCLVINRANK